MSKLIFGFGDKKAKKIPNSRNILGGKGSNLAEMARLGLPVPPGFTISTKMSPKRSSSTFWSFSVNFWQFFTLSTRANFTFYKIKRGS